LTILKIADVPAVFMLKIQKKICAHVAAEGNGSSVTQVYVCVRYITKKTLSLLRRVTARAPHRCMSVRGNV
jgi:hypothetical protein